MNKILDYIEESLVCVCLVVMTALTFVNVVARYVFSASLSFSEEITTYLFVLLSLLGSAIAAKRGAHLGLTIISDRVGTKAGRVLGIISMAFATASATAMGSVHPSAGFTSFFMRLIISFCLSVNIVVMVLSCLVDSCILPYPPGYLPSQAQRK